ncbi:unnamed protein product [Arabidopsis halleri]
MKPYKNWRSHGIEGSRKTKDLQKLLKLFLPTSNGSSGQLLKHEMRFRKKFPARVTQFRGRLILVHFSGTSSSIWLGIPVSGKQTHLRESYEKGEYIHNVQNITRLTGRKNRSMVVTSKLTT